MAYLRRYYGMDREEVATTTIPEARALLRALPDMLQTEAQLVGVAAMGGRLG